MKIYLEAVLVRLQEETTTRGQQVVKRWLTDLLAKDGWWILAVRAKDVCKQLSISYEEPAYYKDVRVWLPDIQYNSMPPCPSCKCPNNVSPHGFRTDYPARRICALNNTYFIMSRRYICGSCKSAAASAKAALADSGVKVVGKVEAHQTFMGWNPGSVTFLPYGLGSFFPAIITHRAGLDMEIVDMMRPLFDKGVRPEAMSSLLLEMHSKTYFRALNQREFAIRRRRVEAGGLGLAGDAPLLFSAFGDRAGYAGVVPTGRYLQHVYILYHESIRPFLEKEVKKRGARTLAWDASYKEAKNLCLFNGKQIFQALITALNEYGEIRIQFHVYSDGHEQFVEVLKRMTRTMEAYGQQLPQLIFVDNPNETKANFLRDLPSLRASQQQLNTHVPPPPTPDLAVCGVDSNRFTLHTGKAEVTNAVIALSSLLSTTMDKVVSFDMEWEVKKSTRGLIEGTGRAALMQFGYVEDGIVKCILLRVNKLLVLPQPLLDLLSDKSITMVGVNLGGDLAKVGRDFSNANMAPRRQNTIELATLARATGVVKTATGAVSLARIVEAVLGEKLNKDPALRQSQWESDLLDGVQTSYAALDAIKSLEAYLKLRALPDLTSRLDAHSVLVGMKVDIMPSYGSIANMASVAAVGEIVDLALASWLPPVGLELTASDVSKLRFVKIEPLLYSFLRYGLRLRARPPSSETSPLVIQFPCL